jgi:isocitrate dehydrogenase
VAHLPEGDFFGSELSVIMPKADTVKIEFVAADGSVKTMKESLKLLQGEVLDASLMSIKQFLIYY